MQTIPVHTESRSYNVLVGEGILSLVGEQTRTCAGGTRAFIVTNTDVEPLYAETVKDSLAAAGYLVDMRVVCSTEAVKNMHELADLLEHMAEAQLTRDDVVVALGGGVVGDLAGFAAASYMRGCKAVQVPTSLLAMVDSSVGGKTAVDLAHGKNLAGAFFQPRCVVASIDCLDTVSRDLFADSCGEVIKYGVMCDEALFTDLESSPLTDSKHDHARLEHIVSRCVAIKRDVVNADEKEKGLRQTLNLGHTIGHAVESANGYALGHGSCVAAGMCIMARACAAKGWCTEEDAQRIEQTVAAHGLPTGSTFSVDELYNHALSDKKRHGDTMNIVVIEGIGHVSVQNVSLEQFKELIALGLESTR